MFFSFNLPWRFFSFFLTADDGWLKPKFNRVHVQKKSSTIGKGKGKGNKEPEAHKNAMEKSKAKQSKQKKKKEKKKDKVQKNKALDERDFNIFGQLFQLLVLKGRKLGINFDL